MNSLNVGNLLNAMETLREMMSKEGKPIMVQPPLYIDVKESYRRWIKARDEHQS